MMYRASCPEKDFSWLTQYWDPHYRQKTPKVFALHECSLIIFAFKRSEDKKSLGLVELSEEQKELIDASQ